MKAFLKDPLWWKLAVWNMLFGLAAAGTLVHFAALMQDRGLSLAQAATAISLVGAGGFVGNLAAGWLIDHTSATRLARLFVLAPLAATAMLFFGSGLTVAITAAVLLGMFNAGDHSLSMFLARRYFSAESFGRASATQQVATVFGSGTAPWLMGVVHDRTGSYDVAIMVAMGAFVLAAVAAWLLPESRRGPPGVPGAASAGAALRRRASACSTPHSPRATWRSSSSIRSATERVRETPRTASSSVRPAWARTEAEGAHACRSMERP
jgi:cyanate permease